MRFFLFPVLALLLSSPVYAEGWRNWYVGIVPGAAHVMTVEESDAQGINAGFESIDQNGDRVMFVLSCYRRDFGSESRFAIAGRLRDIEPPIELLASFDQSPPISLGTFGFLSSALQGELTPQFLAQLMSSDDLQITSPDDTFAAEFPLVGADEAIAGIKCLGDIP